MHTAQLQCPQALQPRNVTFLHHRPSLPSVHSRPTAARAAAAGTKRAAAAAAAPAGRSVLPETAAPSRLLFVGGLPASTHAEDLEQQLAGLCAAAGLQPTRVQVRFPVPSGSLPPPQLLLLLVAMLLTHSLNDSARLRKELLLLQTGWLVLTAPDGHAAFCCDLRWCPSTVTGSAQSLLMAGW